MVYRHQASTTMVYAIIWMLFGAWMLSANRTLASCSNRPGTPNNLVARNIAPGEIFLSWHPTGGESCYDIEVTRNGKVVQQSISGGNCNNSSIKFKTLGYDQTYCFRVRARDGIGTEGCVSELFSNTACSGTSNPPLSPALQPSSNDHYMPNTEFLNPSYARQVLERSDAAACQRICQNDTKCQAWTWSFKRLPQAEREKSACDLKSTVGPTRRIGDMISGTKDTVIVK